MKSSSVSGESKPYPNLTMITSGIILLYSLLFFPICPSPNLAFAIAIEMACFLLFLIPPIRGTGKFALFSWPARKWDELQERFPLVAAAQAKWRKVCILIAFTVISATAIDLTALWMAVTGWVPGAVAVYSALPVSYLFGNHPALSLEMLTGACVESRQYERAETLYNAVLQVRKNVYGPTHPMVAALYADLGDLNQKMNRPAEAESCYLQSLAITEGHGRAIHSLANLMRDSGDAEAKAQSDGFYKRALELRARFFGKASSQYKATLQDYKVLSQH